MQRFHIERVKKYLDLAYEYEAKNVLLVLGEYIWNQEVIPPAEQWKTGVENCRLLGDYAAELGVQIALELEPFHSVAGQLRRYDGPLPRRLQPPGGARRTSTSRTCCLAKVKPEELRRLKGKAIHVHICDCDGKKHGDLPPGRGVVPFEPYLREIKALDIDGAISIELEYSPEPDKIAEWVDGGLLGHRPADAGRRAARPLRQGSVVSGQWSVGILVPKLRLGTHVTKLCFELRGKAIPPRRTGPAHLRRLSLHASSVRAITSADCLLSTTSQKVTHTEDRRPKRSDKCHSAETGSTVTGLPAVPASPARAARGWPPQA